MRGEGEVADNDYDDNSVSVYAADGLTYCFDSLLLSVNPWYVSNK